MLSLYIHFPFCLSKCIYCDFGSKVIEQSVCNYDQFQKDFLECCKRQLYYFANKIEKIEPLNTIYFGGGTPSLLKVDIVNSLIHEVKNLFSIEDNCEITLEANPTSFEFDKFKAFKQAGINRISLGVQSLDNNNLSWLGRRHSAENAVKAIQEIKKIFQKWSFDLIYALPKQTLKEWLKELEQALLLQPQHLSLYTLIVDENTPLGRMVKIGNVLPKTNDEQADFYIATNEYIKNNSKLKHYEVSNYAINGFESEHNLNYWRSVDYIGIGAGAHGRLKYKNCKNRIEIQNIFNYKDWRENILAKSMNGLECEKELTIKEQVEEILLMGLRTVKGIDMVDIENRFKIILREYLNIKKLEFYKNANFLNFDSNHISLNENGLLILDSILADIII